MRTPSWALVIASVVAAFPLSWGLGVLAAYLIAGHDIEQLSALTVPICIAAAVVFALCRCALRAGGSRS